MSVEVQPATNVASTTTWRPDHKVSLRPFQDLLIIILGVKGHGQLRLTCNLYTSCEEKWWVWPDFELLESWTNTVCDEAFNRIMKGLTGSFFSTYWIPGLVQPAGRPPPWPRRPGDRCRQPHSGSACSVSLAPTRTEPSGRGSRSSPAAAQTGPFGGYYTLMTSKCPGERFSLDLLTCMLVRVVYW